MLKTTTILTGAPGAPYYSSDYYLGTTSGEAAVAAAASYDFWFQLENRLSGGLFADVQDTIQLINPTTGEIEDEFSEDTDQIEFSGSGDPLPWTTQMLISIRTNTFAAGRRIRGRKFVPCFSEADSTFGSPSASAITATETAWDHSTSIASAAGGRCIYSVTNHLTGTVTGRTVRTEWSVLRSRRP